MSGTRGVEFEWVPIKQGDVVASASNVSATGTGGTTAQAQLETLKTDVATNARAIADNTGGAPDLTSLRSKVDALYPLTPDVSKLTAWGDIFDPEQTVQNVATVRGYSSFIDFRSTSDRFESTGIVYNAGTGVSDYDNVGGDFHRCFGFRVSGPSAQVLLWVIDNTEVIPFIDMTLGGNFRVNDYTPSRAQDEQVTDQSNYVRSPSTGTGTIAVGGAASTYTLTPYPANSSAQTRLIYLSFEVLIDGTDALAGGFVEIETPDTNLAQAKQTIEHTFFLGFPVNRTVVCEIGYEYRIPASDYLLDLTLETAPSDVTLRVVYVDVRQSYTASVIIPRVDNFITLTDGGTPFTFTGSHELLVAFHPIGNTSEMQIVPVVANTSTGATTQLNDETIPEPHVAFNEIRAPDSIEFRSFLPDHFLRHIDLVNLLRDRDTKWAYALARLQEVTENAFTAPVDLAAGSKLNTVALVAVQKVTHYEAVNTGTGAGGLLDEITLPTDYADSDYIYVEILDTGKFASTFIATRLLSQVLFTAGDTHAVDDKTELEWTVATRLLAVQGGTNLISRVELLTVT